MKIKFKVMPPSYTIETEVERESGVYTSKEELAEYIVAALEETDGDIIRVLEDADPRELGGNQGGKYITTSWNVSEISGVTEVTVKE